MKNMLCVVVAVMLGLAAGVAQADRLEDIRKKGVLTVGVFDQHSPYGFTDQKTNKVIGIDIDLAQEIANKMGVKLKLVPVSPADRVPALVAGKVDLVIAGFTITDERAKQIDFTIPYFASGQQFLTRKGIKLAGKDDLARLRLGVGKGTSDEERLRSMFPDAILVVYEDMSHAFRGLRAGKVDAISQGEPELIYLLASAPDRVKYVIQPLTVSDDLDGVGVVKGEATLRNEVNDVLMALEKEGRAEQVYNKWFGPQTQTPLKRAYKIGYGKMD